MLNRVHPFVICAEEGILHGREMGRDIRNQIAARLEDASPDSLMPIDFRGIRFIDFSAADEIVAKLLKRVTGGDLGERYVLLFQMPDLVRENVQAALELRSLVCVHETSDGTVELVGKVNPEIQETYDLARSLGQLTARDITKAMDKGITASSNRLARLRELGILARVGNEAVEAGGRQNIYKAVS